MPYKGAILCAIAICALISAAPVQAARYENTYSQDEIGAAVEEFFQGASDGLAKVIEKAFKDLGRPVGYIRGNEGGGAFVVGLRYGEGVLHMKNKGSRKVFWRGPSVGFDFGGNAAKVFTLVYGLRRSANIYQRFPGVDGSAYFVGGVSMNYQRLDNVTLAPIRTGVGLRLGANVGYLHYSRDSGVNPF